MTITAPGIYTLPESEYHADPCPAPSLSSGIGRLLLRRSPMHAAHAHPRIGAHKRKVSDEMEQGSVLHAMLLGIGSAWKVAQFDDWRTNAAKAVRDEARAGAVIPILAHKAAELETVASNARTQMDAHPALRQMRHEPGVSEAVVVWQEGDVWCRAMVDRLPDAPGAPIFDLKTTGLSAAPRDWQRSLERDYAFQAAFYLRGVAAVRGVWPPEMRFAVIERDAPYALSVMAAAPSLMRLAEAEVDRAIRIWGECLRSDSWPGYPAMTAYVEASPWRLAAEEERAAMEEFDQGDMR